MIELNTEQALWLLWHLDNCKSQGPKGEGIADSIYLQITEALEFFEENGKGR